MSDTERISATGFLTIEPTWRGDRLVGASIAKVSKNKPRGGHSSVGSAVVKVTIDLPRRVFIPFEAEALVEAQEGDTGVVRVVVQPFPEEPADEAEAGQL